MGLVLPAYRSSWRISRSATWRIALACLLCLVCSGSTGRRAGSQKRPVLTVGTDFTPPFYQQLPDGRIVGIAVDVLQRAASKLDFDLRFVPLTGIPDTHLRSHAVDLWPVLTITEQRSKEFHMTPPWLNNTFCLLHLAGSKLPEASQLRLAHWTNPVNRQHAYHFFPLARKVVLLERLKIVEAVCSGAADAGLIEIRVLDSFLLNRPSVCDHAALERIPIPGAVSHMGIAAVKSASAQADQLHRQITRMADSGELAQIFEQSSTLTSNEANAIVALNSAQQRTRFAYGTALFLLVSGAGFFWQSRRTRAAYRLMHRETLERKRAEEALLSADRTRFLLLEGAGDGICGLDAQGRTTFLNSAALRLLGLEQASTANLDFHALVHGHDLRSCSGSICLLAAAIRTSREIHLDSGEFYHSSGKPFSVEFTCSPLNSGETESGFVVTFKDITARKQAELLDRDRNAVLEMLAQNESLNSIFEAIAHLIERQCPGLHCTTMAVTGGRLELRAAPTLPEELANALRTVEIGPCSRSCGAAAYWSKPVAVTEIETDLLWEYHRKTAIDCGIRSCWSYPILSATNDVLGTIAVYGSERRGPDFNHQILLQVACRLARLAIEQTRLTQQLHHQAHFDSLTGFPNRLLFGERLRQSLFAARSSASLCALFYIDLDRFKQINDTLSHHVGDLYLCQVAKRLERVLPEFATLARLGGDEFAVVVPSVSGNDAAESIARNLLQTMTVPFTIENHTLFGTASVGISLSNGEIAAAELQSRADQAMYRAKSLGRNRYQFYSADMSENAIAQLETERFLREGLDLGRFVLYFQPQCRPNGDLVGFEALIRLTHPERGLIPPNEFIGVAEETGLIVPIGSWVLRETCRQLAAWREDGFAPATVAINVSAAQFAKGTFAEEVADAVREYAIDPCTLEIELTESMIMENFDESVNQMLKLRALGVQLSLDDFGTGYSSLSNLHRLPVQTIKIDQAFVRGMDAVLSTRPLVEAIIAAARSFGCDVIAEGVETDAQRRELASMGCNQMQGYFFSRPLPASQVHNNFQVALAS